jgi:uncharacterized protein (TIGR02466 family)
VREAVFGRFVPAAVRLLDASKRAASRLVAWLAGVPRRPLPAFTSPHAAWDYLAARYTYTGDPVYGVVDFYWHPEVLQAALEAGTAARLPVDCDDVAAWAHAALSAMGAAPGLVVLYEEIDAALAEYVKTTIAPVGDVKFLPTQAWLNFTTQGQWHHKHAHPGSLISGVYYVAASGDTDRIMFFRGGYKRVPFTQAEFNPWNSDSWWIPVAAGDLVLFPSELEHMVPPVTTDSTRISLSFNTWFEGSAGAVENLTHLAVSLSGPYADGGAAKSLALEAPRTVAAVS